MQCAAEAKPAGMRRIALLGAESTGKTTLAEDMARVFNGRGWRCLLIREYLREWCDTQGRTPQRHEQIEIARTQQQRIDQATAADWLIADSTPLLTALYSELLYGDSSLLPFALASLRQFDFILLTATDLPWRADGIQRSSPEQRDRFDTRLRETLNAANHSYRVVYGCGKERLKHAMASVGALEASLGSGDASVAAASDAIAATPWRWSCEKCSDPDCEHRLFTQRLRQVAG